MLAIAESDIKGRADNSNNADERSIYFSTNTGAGIGGNRAKDSSQALSTHGQSSLCPVSSFKLKTRAAFSTT